jgi:hypothetical protein
LIVLLALENEKNAHPYRVTPFCESEGDSFLVLTKEEFIVPRAAPNTQGGTARATLVYLTFYTKM